MIIPHHLELAKAIATKRVYLRGISSSSADKLYVVQMHNGNIEQWEGSTNVKVVEATVTLSLP